MERLLWYLFAGSRGGPTRIRILAALLDRPYNLNQLAKHLGMDYKTVDHNLRVLMKHVIVVCPEAGSYGATYHPSKNFLANRQVFDDIVRKTRPAGVPLPEMPPERRDPDPAGVGKS